MGLGLGFWVWGTSYELRGFVGAASGLLHAVCQLRKPRPLLPLRNLRDLRWNNTPATSNFILNLFVAIACVNLECWNQLICKLNKSFSIFFGPGRAYVFRLSFQRWSPPLLCLTCRIQLSRNH